MTARRGTGPAFFARSFADILALIGFEDAQHLHAMTQAWRSLVELVDPVLVIGDFDATEVVVRNAAILSQDAPVKVAIEAGIRQGWDHIIGTDGIFIGMTGFGASGTIEQLYPHFGITAEAAASAAEARIKG